MTERILLGFEVGSGEPVHLPLHHLAIFGMTQLSGKTTTLEALISRSGLRAVAFITKRGEAGFTSYNLITPYYKPRADWQFVEGLVNVALGEKVKYEPGMRWAIIKVSKGAKNLRDVKAKAEEMLAKAKRDFQKQLFEKLITYLEIVVPELERWNFSDRLELSEGVNVMDLSGMRLETQHLVIASTIDYAFQNLDHVVVIVPEAWETLPQFKMTPVKWVAQQFIRKGAAIGNYLWLDSQDIGGIDKTPLRQCDNWLMGRMKEAHEVERILKQLLGTKVKAEEIQTLPLGHFYAVIGNEVKKVYVLPAGVPEAVGREVALDKRGPESVRDGFLKPRMEDEDLVWKERYEQLKAEIPRLVEEARRQAYREAMQKLDEVKKQWNVEEYQQTIAQLKDDKATLEAELKKLEPLKAFKEALMKFLGENAPLPDLSIPSGVTVQHEAPALTVQILRKPLVLSTDNAQGRLALLYAEGFFDEEERTISIVQREMMRRGWPKDPRLSGFLDEICSWGYLRKRRTDRWLYQAAIKSAEARSKGLLKEVEVS
ncbi:MAG: hypothetical protein QXQ94_08495 [Candidatus Bathyarchaeia archaeon]